MIGAQPPEFDVTDDAKVRQVMTATRPALVVNCAAYTAVDRAESEPELVRRVNADGAGRVARTAQAVGSRVIHLSTDYVFDGLAGRPYQPDEVPAPLSVYGRTKLEGERQVLAAGDTSLVIRTAWVYAAEGKNFVLTILRLLAERREVRVVDDQVGTPTWATGLARAIWRAADLPDLHGVHHWTDAGVASWYDFAVAIREEALALAFFRRAGTVVPIPSSAYPTAARRPPFSVLEKRGTWAVLGLPPHWREQLRTMLAEYHAA
jgi:dTDP-4-dehydrorhamnose reductase